jgi:type VI secretion system secreted protein Hcp
MADYFLKVDGIQGESTDAQHKGEIDVLAFSWGVGQAGGAATGSGAGAGKAVFDDLLVVAHTSKASPLLWLACASGTHIKTAVLTARKAGKPPQEFLTIVITDVLVSSFEVDGSDEDHPLDQVSFSYAKVETHYTPADETGKPQPPVSVGWDLKTSKEI